MPVAVEASDEDESPIPSDIKTVFLGGGRLLMAVLAGCYVAAEIVLPIVLAFVLDLVLQPAMRVLDRTHIRPRLLPSSIILESAMRPPHGALHDAPSPRKGTDKTSPRFACTSTYGVAAKC